MPPGENSRTGGGGRPSLVSSVQAEKKGSKQGEFVIDEQPPARTGGKKSSTKKKEKPQNGCGSPMTINHREKEASLRPTRKERKRKMSPNFPRFEAQTKNSPTCVGGIQKGKPAKT